MANSGNEGKRAEKSGTRSGKEWKGTEKRGKERIGAERSSAYINIYQAIASSETLTERRQKVKSGNESSDEEEFWSYNNIHFIGSTLLAIRCINIFVLRSESDVTGEL